MFSYFNKYGLLNSEFDVVERCDENAILYQLQYIQKLQLEDPSSIELNNRKQAALEYIKLCKIKDGLYNQRPNNPEPISHDQLTSFIIISKLCNMKFHREIWEEIKRQKFGYNNFDSTWRPLHPRDIIYYGILCGCKLWWILYLPFLLISIISVWGTYYTRPQIDIVIKNWLKNGKWEQNTLIESSAKLLSWTRCIILFPKTFKILSFFVFKTSIFKSWKEVFSYYFKDQNHPLNLL